MTTIDAPGGRFRAPMTTADWVTFKPGWAPPIGPVFVNDAEPGDLLAVEILDIVPADEGFTLTAPGRW